MKDQGGPVFPSDYVLPENQGLTVRDYFAAKALHGLLTEPVTPGSTAMACHITGDFTSSRETVKGERLATAAYRLADAMLKVRSL